MTTAAPAKVAVVLCTWQGETYLNEQLDSIARQSVPCRLFVHDDASRDTSAALASAHPAVESVSVRARNVGPVRSFEHALRAALEQDVDYIAFADQDDLWRADRIEKGLEAMHALEARHDRSMPRLVHSDLEMIDAAGRTIAPSFLRWRRYDIDGETDLPRMLGRCGVMGNTCLLNRPLAELALPFPRALHMHDWWVGVLAELYGDRAFVPDTLVRYRIHADNASNSLTALTGGAGPMTPRRLWRRDFRLPYREDTRREVLEHLLDGDGHRTIPSEERRQVIEAFCAYLAGRGTRRERLRWLLGESWLARSPRVRLRVACALLLSARYE